MRKRVIFRADGSSTIGLGHLYRSLALAEMVNSSFEPFFCVQQAPDSFLNLLTEKGYRYSGIHGHDELQDKCFPGDILVWDHYHFDDDLFSKLKGNNIRIVLVDDHLRADRSIDVILNHAPGTKPNDYHENVGSDTKFALGLPYAILQPVFLNAARAPIHRRNETGLLICFGGADPHDWTLRCVRALQGITRFSCIDVVVGAAYSHPESLKELERYSPNVRLFRNLDPTEMVARMASNSFAIVPSSSVLYEAVALSMLCITFPYVDNQERIFSGFCDLGVIVPMAVSSDVPEAVDRVFQNRKAIENRLPVIDGYSGDRILELFKSLAA